MFMNLKTQNCTDAKFPQTNIQIQWDPNQIPEVFCKKLDS